ncbi:hypothetical protein AAFC00_001370 [Neodothiora populina]
MPDPAGSSSAVKRACDCCHKRKVKCIGDGTRPCKNCTAAGLTCTYNAIPQKKGPKGSRAKVISELRETQRQTQLAARARHGLGFEASQYATAFSRTPELLSMELITSCVDYFFAKMYPTQPIIHRQKVGETIGQMENSIEAYCLLVSLCAYMLIQPNLNLPAGIIPDQDSPQAKLNMGQTLLEEALRVRKGYDYVESPSVWSIITSFFFFGSYFCLDKHNTAWFHLREATTLAQLLGMHEESHYATDVVEAARRRRLYWLLFVTERAYALQRHRPLTLHATVGLPQLNDDPAETAELNGFIHLVNLFKPFDDSFVGLWNKARVGCSTEWLARLQNQLSDALPTYLHCTESQAVDLRTSQQWLRTMVWQLSISHGYLSSAAQESAMSFKYPIEISRDLIAQSSGFSQGSMEIHGIGLVEKLFDVACTLTDVMSCVPFEQHTFEYGPRDYLNQFLSLISTLRGGQQRYLPLLLSKINDTLPTMPMPGYSMVSVPGGRGRIDEIYDSSNPNSGDSTPFGSPPPQPVAPPLFQSAFGEDFKSLPAPTSTGYPMMTSAAPFPALPAASAIPPLYQDPARSAFSNVTGQAGFDPTG